MQRHGQCQLFGLILKNRGVSRTLSKIQDEKFAKIVNGFYQRYHLRFLSLREKCPYSESFWSAFSRIRNEYGESISPYLVKMQENAGQNNSEYGHFLRSVEQRNIKVKLEHDIKVKHLKHKDFRELCRTFWIFAFQHKVLSLRACFKLIKN